MIYMRNGSGWHTGSRSVMLAVRQDGIDCIAVL